MVKGIENGPIQALSGKIAFVYCIMFSASGVVEMLSKFLKLDGLIENVSGYIDTRVKLLKIEVREDVAKVMTRALMFGVLFLIAFLFIVFLSIGIALMLNQYFTNNFAGFLIVSGFYLFFFLLAAAMRKQIHDKLEHLFSEKLKPKE
jgi:uncharacterized membrane protein YqjE